MIIQALLDFGSKINAMGWVYVLNLGLRVRKTIIGDQKYDGLILRIHGMVIAGLSLQDKLWQDQFFKQTLVLADISVNMALKMLFFSLSNADKPLCKWREFT